MHVSPFRCFGLGACGVILMLAAGSAGATTALWTNTANGTVDSWTTVANWNAASYPGADGSYQNAFLTNRVSGSVYKAVVSTALPFSLGTVEIKNNGGGEAWLIVTNATVAITNLLVRTQGRLEIDAAGVVTNATVTMDGTNGQIQVNSGGCLYSATNLNVGSTAGGTNNLLTIGDGGRVSVAGGGFIIGNGSSRNQLLVPGSNVIIRTTGTPVIGLGSFNTALFTGEGTLWDWGSSGQQGRVGQSGNSNMMIVSQGSLTLTNHATFNIGYSSGAINNWLIVTNGGRFYTRSAVGIESSSNNTILVTGIGSLWDNAANRALIGNDGSSLERLIVDQGGTVSNCSVMVGATYTSSSGNTLLITNGGRWFVGTAATYSTAVGYYGTNNSAVVTGSNSLWDLGMHTLYVGQGTPGTCTNVTATLRVDNNGTITNGVFSVGAGATSYGNTLIVTNGGQLFCQTGTVGNVIGSSCSSNLVLITGPGSIWNCTNQAVTVGTGAAASNNVLRIENGAVVTNSGIPSIGGSGGVNNMLIVTNGGQYWVAAGYSGGMGGSASSNLILIAGNNATFGGLGIYCNLTIGSPCATGNVMVVDNGGVCPTWATVSVGKSTNCVGNQLIITNGGYLQGTGVYVNYRGTNNWSNAVVVVNGGVLESPNLVADSGGDLTPLNGYNCITNSGGVYQFTTVTPTISPVPAHNSLIYLDSGTIAYRALSTANVKLNWSGSQLTNITYAVNGHNGFRLNNATNVTSPDQSYTFATGLGATNYSRLELINGSQYRGGTVTIGNGGTLAMWGAPSTITNLTIGATGALEITLNGTNSAPQLTAVGSVALGGALNVILAGPPPPAGWSTTLINKTSAGAMTGHFNNGPLRASYLGTNYAFGAIYSSSTLVLSSQGKATAGTVLLFR